MRYANFPIINKFVTCVCSIIILMLLIKRLTFERGKRHDYFDESNKLPDDDTQDLKFFITTLFKLAPGQWS